MNLFKQTTLIGIGLIGSSIARAIKKKNLSKRICIFSRSQKTINKAKKLLEKDFKPITDARASKKYRMEVAKNLLEKCFLEVKQKKLVRISA